MDQTKLYTRHIFVGETCITIQTNKCLRQPKRHKKTNCILFVIGLMLLSRHFIPFKTFHFQVISGLCLFVNDGMITILWGCLTEISHCWHIRMISSTPHYACGDCNAYLKRMQSHWISAFLPTLCWYNEFLLKLHPRILHSSAMMLECICNMVWVTLVGFNIKLNILKRLHNILLSKTIHVVVVYLTNTTKGPIRHVTIKNNHDYI